MRKILRNTTNFLRGLFLFVLVNGAVSFYSQAADCVTVSDEVWDCGIPSFTDNLFVYHSVSISGGFNVMSSVTIYDGGTLTISGNLRSQSGTIIIKEGGKLIVEGGSIFTNDSNIQIEGGEMLVDGNMNITGNTALAMTSGSLLDVSDNMSINTNSVNIDGTVNVGNNFNNNSDITGLGQINYNGSCLGSGSINESYSSDYCGSGTINMVDFSCVPSDNTPPVISNMPADKVIDLPVDACDASVNWVLPTVNDDCYLDSFTSSHNSGDVFSIGTTTVTYTAIDKAGNATTDSFTVTVNDVFQPSMSNIPGSFTVNAAPGECGTIVTWTEPTVNDNCTVNATSDYSSGDYFPIGVTNVTYTATDLSGNFTTGSFAVHVEHGGIPVTIDCPENIITYVNSKECEVVVTWSDPSSAACWSNVVQSHNSGDLFSVGNHQVVYEYTDASSNTSTCSFNIAVLDTISPSVSNLPANIEVSTDPGSCGANVNWTAPTVNDNCSATLSSSHSSGDLFPLGETTVTYTATDPSGNSSTEAFTIKVLDDIDPVISNLPANIEVSTDPGSCGATVNWTAPTVNDNCSATLSSSHASGELFPLGETTVTYTATDPSGNSSTEAFTIKVLDDIDPVISNLPANIEVSTDPGSCGATVNWTAPTVNDNCSATLSSTHSSGDLFPIGETIVTYSASDPAGNVTKETFTISVIHSDAPLYSQCPSDITLYLEEGQCETQATWMQPEVTGCNVNLTQSHSPGDLFTVGYHKVKYEYFNSTGVSSVCTFTVVVLDTISPQFTTFPGDIKVSAKAQSCSGIPNWNAPEAVDQCGQVKITSSHDSNEAFPIGETSVEYIATDQSGNTTKRSFIVTVEDKTSPVFTFCPKEFNIVSFDSKNKKAIVNWEQPTAEDACTDVTINSSHTSGDAFGIGFTTVIFTAVDEFGNESQCSLEIEVQPDVNQAPVVDDVYLVAEAGESIDITLNASDPNGNQLSLVSIENNENNSFISNIDEQFLSFTYTAFDDFEGTDTVYVVVEDDGLPQAFSTAKVVIEINKNDEIKTSSVLTINGDHLNDIWTIENIESFPDNKVHIFDRMGSCLFKASGYDNNSVIWDGSVQQGGNMVPTGTYFYVIDLGDGSKVLSGAIEVIR